MKVYTLSRIAHTLVHLSLPVSMAAMLVLALTLMLAGPAHAADRTVTNTNDSGSGSLRATIGSASSGDRIVFNLTYPAKITLSSDIAVSYTHLTLPTN